MVRKISDAIRRVLGIQGLKAEQIHIEKILCQYQRDQHSLHYETRRNYLADHILSNKTPGVSSERYAPHDIIVSLTTYGRRIYDVALTIESIMQQSMKANRIVLWLDDSFKGNHLPTALTSQMERGLEIAYCKDIRSYKKLIPSLKSFPDDAIITVDDDALYDPYLLCNLISAYQKNRNSIHCCRAHRMLFDADGTLKPYNQWEACVKETGINKNLFFTGVGGVLYPPHSLDEAIFDEEAFLDICPDADDVWFNAMAILRGTTINRVFTPSGKNPYLINEAVQDIALSIKNVGEGGNDRQIQAVFSKYGLFTKLKTTDF